MEDCCTANPLSRIFLRLYLFTPVGGENFRNYPFDSGTLGHLVSLPARQKSILQYTKEQVRIFPMVEAIVDLSEIEGQVLLAKAVVSSVQLLLQDRPNGFDTVRVDIASDVLPHVVDPLYRELNRDRV